MTRLKAKNRDQTQKDTRKNKRLELKVEHTKQQLATELLKTDHASHQQLIELQKLDVQKRLLTVNINLNYQC